jgi:hypothetical protein
MLKDDPEVQRCLDLMAEKLYAIGKDSLAFKMENLIELLTEELEAEQKKKP